MTEIMVCHLPNGKTPLVGFGGVTKGDVSRDVVFKERFLYKDVMSGNVKDSVSAGDVQGVQFEVELESDDRSNIGASSDQTETSSEEPEGPSLARYIARKVIKPQLRAYDNGIIVYLLLYADDMLVAGKDKVETDATKALLMNEFEIKDLREARKILDMEISCHTSPQAPLDACRWRFATSHACISPKGHNLIGPFLGLPLADRYLKA
ncbi:hypothetical protein L1987_32850 [Smallanthus sonchifolius]|uniref:Uncharacterized protein n=1 Tax=Smallanthus sonchifolius TaxID=185202 RepID=A0ACB9HQS1_9ASTR|nr:hypothetical protein L1987_32850 [Smallanthus sonchifolius]